MIAKYTAAQALQRAQAESSHRTQDWTAMCLAFVHEMVGIPALYPSAIAAWKGAKVRHVNASPPAGAAVFYSGGQFGHVMLSAGGGLGWSNDLIRRGQIDRVSVQAPVVKWGHTLLGWTEDLNNWKLQLEGPPPRLSLSEVKWAATHNNLIPGSEGRIRLVRASLRAVGCGDDSTDTFRHMWQLWQLHLGYRGVDADGIPGAASVAALAGRCGYVVTP